MKINVHNSNNEFAKYYLTRFVDPSVKEHSFFKDSADNLNINLDYLQSLNISKKEILDFILTDTPSKFQESFSNILKEYTPIIDSNLSILQDSLDKLIPLYNNYLSKLFNVEINIPQLDIFLIPTRIKKNSNQKNYFASVHNKRPNTIFLVIYTADDLAKEENILMYLKVIIHEFTHVFLNNTKIFEKVIFKIKTNNYIKLNTNLVKITKLIKELICISMSFAIYDFGLAFNLFNWLEDLEMKSKVLEVNNYISETRNFLIMLNKDLDKDKFYIYFENYIEKLIVLGIKTANYRDLYKILK